MLHDFERLYFWKARRLFRSPKLVLVVLPKELHIPSMVQFWNEQGKRKFAGSFVRYVEWFGGRLATAEDEIETIDPEDYNRWATECWLSEKIDTKKIGVKEFRPIEDEIAENERRLKAENG